MSHLLSWLFHIYLPIGSGGVNSKICDVAAFIDLVEIGMLPYDR
jgi:hypothetical protein